MARGLEPVNFAAMVAKLRRDAPPLLPVRVYVRAKLDGGWGETSLILCGKGRPMSFVIAIKRSLRVTMRDTLIHEWAHALTWAEGEHVETDHGDSWALAYGRVYRVLIEP